MMNAEKEDSMGEAESHSTDLSASIIQHSEFSHYPSHPPPIRLHLVEMPEHPCPYLPGRLARTRAFRADWMPADVYAQFMDAAFRRSGLVIYQPICHGCRACVPIRLAVGRFEMSKSQRRCWRRNSDLQMDIAEPRLTEEKFELYARYTSQWHDRDDPPTMEELETFLYQSPIDTIEMTYRDPAGRLLAVGICDVAPTALSSVYFYFDPKESKRGLGTFGVLKEINWARESGIDHYYLGYWVQGCAAMDYKAAFHPSELLNTNGVWQAFMQTPTHRFNE